MFTDPLFGHPTLAYSPYLDSKVRGGGGGGGGVDKGSLPHILTVVHIILLWDEEWDSTIMSRSFI